MKLFLWHIYYSLYIRREARRDLHTEQAFKEDFLLFFDKSIAGMTLMYASFRAYVAGPPMPPVYLLSSHTRPISQAGSCKDSSSRASCRLKSGPLGLSNRVGSKI